jgi:hypothetical protein
MATPKKANIQSVIKIKRGSSIADILPFSPTDERKVSWEKQPRVIKQWQEIEVRSLSNNTNLLATTTRFS